MQILRETLFLLLTFLDIEFTKRRLSEYGIKAELNGFVRKLCYLFGIDYGVALGVLIPTAGLAIGGWFFPNVLSFMIGVRFCLFLFQQRELNGK